MMLRAFGFPRLIVGAVCHTVALVVSVSPPLEVRRGVVRGVPVAVAHFEPGSFSWHEHLSYEPMNMDRLSLSNPLEIEHQVVATVGRRTEHLAAASRRSAYGVIYHAVYGSHATLVADFVYALPLGHRSPLLDRLHSSPPIG